jgi:hypothetical protein
MTLADTERWLSQGGESRRPVRRERGRRGLPFQMNECHVRLDITLCSAAVLRNDLIVSQCEVFLNQSLIFSKEAGRDPLIIEVDIF